MRVILLLLLCSLVVGCGKKTEPSPAGEAKGFEDYAAVRKALMGANADDVRKALGAPDSVETSATYPGSHVWHYSSFPAPDGKRKSHKFWLVVDNGRVVEML